MGETVKILFAGDTFPVQSNIELFKSGGLDALFGSRIIELFRSADYSVCNPEGCFTDTGVPVEKVGPIVKAPTDSINALKQLGIRAMTLANTHTLDFGKKGHDEMRSALTKNGIEYFGTGDDASSIKSLITLSIKGRTIILYTVTELFVFNTPGEDKPGANGYDEYKVCRELSELKKQCDHLVVLYHGGTEMSHYNNATVRRRFHRMADNGADIIISQHSHAVGLEERYNGSYLLYGQGNFCFNLGPTINEFNGTGILLEVLFKDDGFDVKKHLVRRTKNGCTYDEEQDFKAFYERSRMHDALLKGDSDALLAFDREFDRVSSHLMDQLMTRVFQLDLPDGGLVKYLTEHYTSEQLLVLNMLLTNDEYNETTVRCFRMALDSKE